MTAFRSRRIPACAGPMFFAMACLFSPTSAEWDAALPFPVLASRDWIGERFPEPVEIRLHAADGKTPGRPLPAIVYLMNHAAERVGTEHNEPIVRDFLADGFAVVTADFRHHPDAVPPVIDWDIMDLANTLRAGRLFDPMPVTVDRNWVYVVPEGFRLARDLVYWEIDRHGAHGTLEFILREYNRRSGRPPAARVEEMRRPDGGPIDYKLRMDIIYPSRPESPAPVFMVQSSSNPRNGWQTRRPHHIGFMLRGYAFAHYEHNFNPIARSDHFGFYHPYSLDPYNGVASNTAAVRFVRAHAGQFGLDPDLIGIWGLSKASYGAALLGNPRNATLREASRFEGFPSGSPEPQPWPEHESGVAVGYHAAGDGSQRHRSLIDPDYVPTLTSIGDRDSYIAAEYWQEHFHHLEKMGVPHLALFMEGVDHTFPHGFDSQLNLDRYAVCFDFFEVHLRPDPGRPPVLLHALPLDGDGEVVAHPPVELRFATPMAPDTITGLGGVSVVGGNAPHTVAGDWQVLQRNTLFRWRPVEPLIAGEPYVLNLPSTMATDHGVPTGSARRHRFTAGEAVEKLARPVDEYRRRHDLLFGIDDVKRPPFGVWPIVGVNVDQLPAFSISPYSSLHYTAGYRIVEDDRSDGSGRYYLRWRSGGQGEIKIDFGEPRTVSHLVLTSGTGGGRELVAGLRLRSSNTGPDAMETVIEIKDNADPRLSLVFPPVTARWFQIDRIPLSAPVRIHDLEMYEQPRPLKPELRLVDEGMPDPVLKGGEPALRALAVDGTIREVAFRINGVPSTTPVTRRGNLFSTEFPESVGRSVRIEAIGMTSRGEQVEAEPLSRLMVRPQLDLIGAFPVGHGVRAGDWRIDDSQGMLSPSSGMLLSGEGAWGDYVVEADVEVEDLAGVFHLIFRALDSRHHGRFEFRRSRAEMRFVENGQAERIRRNFDLTLREGGRYRLRMEVYGRKVRLLVDGVEAFVFQPLDRGVGGFGFQTENARVRIRDLRVFFPDLPTEAAAFDALKDSLFPVVDPLSTNRSTSVFAPDTPWFSSSPGDLVVEENRLRQKATETSFIVAYPTGAGDALRIGPGQTLAVTYEFSVEGISPSARSPWFRVGIFDSSFGAGRIRADGFGVSQVEFSGYRGYLLDAANMRAGTFSLQRRSLLSSNNLMSSLRVYSRLADPASAGPGLRDGARHRAKFLIRRHADDSVDLTVSVQDENGDMIYSHGLRSTEDPVTSFDTFAFLLSGTGANAFTLHRVDFSLIDP